MFHVSALIARCRIQDDASSSGSTNTGDRGLSSELACVRMNFFDIPNLDELILPHATDQFKTLALLEQTCKANFALSRQDGALSWKKYVQHRWGPVASNSSMSSWRELAVGLERDVRPLLNANVAMAVSKLEETFLPPGVPWHETLRCCTSWCTLLERRHIVAFVCAERHGRSTLAAYLAPIPIRGNTPEQALRRLLLVFPFLPIDAGQGADHVIGLFSLAYIRQNPEALAALGLAPAPHLGASSSSDSDEPVDGQPQWEQSWLALQGYQAGASGPSGSVSAAAWRPQTAAERTGRDLLYTLIYSIIMLNTDLHNPAIHPKLQPEEYAASCRRCVQVGMQLTSSAPLLLCSSAPRLLASLPPHLLLSSHISSPQLLNSSSLLLASLSSPTSPTRTSSASTRASPPRP